MPMLGASTSLILFNGSNMSSCPILIFYSDAVGNVFIPLGFVKLVKSFVGPTLHLIRLNVVLRYFTYAFVQLQATSRVLRSEFIQKAR